MPNEVDKSLLDRLQALRGASSSPSSTTEQNNPVKWDAEVYMNQADTNHY